MDVTRALANLALRQVSQNGRTWSARRGLDASRRMTMGGAPPEPSAMDAFVMVQLPSSGARVGKALDILDSSKPVVGDASGDLLSPRGSFKLAGEGSLLSPASSITHVPSRLRSESSYSCLSPRPNRGDAAALSGVVTPVAAPPNPNGLAPTQPMKSPFARA